MSKEKQPRRSILRSLGHRMGVATNAEVRDVEHELRLEIEKQNIEVQERLTAILDETRFRWQQEDEATSFLLRQAHARIEAEKLSRERVDQVRREISALRESPDYSQAWDDDDPLVSVRIASYSNTEALVERAIPSVLRQSHQNLELIIVNDGPNPKTAEAIRSIQDERIHYEEFSERSRYPEDAHLRWMVAGSPGMNRGAEIASGRWLAPLDDDDEFEPDHIESLLEHARATKAEFVYGAIRQKRLATGDEVRIFSDPPTISQISMQAALYHSGLKFMTYDTESWRVDEPGDWNLIRRMMESGVRMAAIDRYVTTVFMLPYSRKQEV